jgi:putative ABC transport system permease protein
VSVRAREVGLRKTLGATQGDLVAQFLVESTVMAALAALIGLALIEVSLNAFNALLQQSIVLEYFGTQGVLLPLLVMVVIVGIAGGWYPALVLSRLRPREALQGQHGVEGSGRLRQLLVIAQFSVAIGLMTCMSVIYLQTERLRTMDMGYQPEGLYIIRGLRTADGAEAHRAFMDRVKALPGAVGVTRALFDPTNGKMARQPIILPGATAVGAPQVAIQAVDWDYVEVYGGRIVAGRDLSRNFANDDVDRPDGKDARISDANVLVNRSMMSMYGVSEPAALIGKTFAIAGEGSDRTTLSIVGVVDDIRIRSARDPKEPMFYLRSVKEASSIGVRFRGVSPAKFEEQLRPLWAQAWPDRPMLATLADDAIAKFYDADRRRGTLFALFAGVALILCAIGVYGLAVFTAQRRTKEIGIRKVLGASVWDIVRLLMLQFSWPVLIAMALAWPLAWWAMRGWLNSFSAPLGLTVWPFLLAGLAGLAAAWISVGSHAIRVARQSPVLALKHD